MKDKIKKKAILFKESNTPLALLASRPLFILVRAMKRRRKTLSEWKNPLARKAAVIVLLAVCPLWILLQILWSLVMHGVPETWDDIMGLFRADAFDAIKEAWLGREQYRMNIQADTRND